MSGARISGQAAGISGYVDSIPRHPGRAVLAAVSMSGTPRAKDPLKSKERILDDAIDPPLIYKGARPGVPAFYGFLPSHRQEDGALPLVVCVHGISRDAREQIELLRPEAESRGYGLLAPHFEEAVYGDYQRLGRRGRGARADLALLDTCAQFETMIGRTAGPLFLIGFSGGSQFVHRFAMAHPERVSAAVCASAGWYSFPEAQLRYPRGLRVDGDLARIRFDPDAFLRIPMLVTVGSEDTRRDESVRSSRRLDEMQGRNRLERARNWSQSMAAAAQKRGMPIQARYRELSGAGHSFRECVDAGLDRIGFDFFDRVREEDE